MIPKLRLFCLVLTKVVPLSAVGPGIPSAASATVVAREGAAATQTVASGSALVQGMAGAVYEQQVRPVGQKACVRC